MKIFVNILILICFSQFSIAQNLVPNPSFEQYDTCPNSSSQINYASGWRAFCNTPDYYNKCSTNSGWSVPSNSAGFQETYLSLCKSYIGLYSSFLTINNPEYAGIQLTSPLIIGHKYYVTIKVNLANQSNCATNNIGILFTTVPFYEATATSIKNYSHVYSTQIITDTVNWSIISGSFIADSVYNYIVLGNFFSDSLTSKIILQGTSCLTPYYLLDDICVSDDSIICNPLLVICNTSISKNYISPSIEIFPNPFSNKTTLEINNDENIEFVRIYISDIFGRTMRTINTYFKNNTEINRENLQPGIYFLSITFNNKEFKQKIIITN